MRLNKYQKKPFASSPVQEVRSSFNFANCLGFRPPNGRGIYPSVGDVLRLWRLRNKAPNNAHQTKDPRKTEGGRGVQAAPNPDEQSMYGGQITGEGDASDLGRE